MSVRKASAPCPVCVYRDAGLGQISTFALGVALGSSSGHGAAVEAACAEHRPELVVGFGRAALALADRARPIGEPAPRVPS